MAKLEITFPLFNDQDMFKRALTALSQQTFTDFHITAIDDASPTCFNNEIKSFPNLNINVIKNPKNLGAMSNIWKSISLPTEATYIMSHHVDDFLKTDYLEKAVNIMEANPDISFVLTGPEWVTKDKPYEAVAIGETKYTIFDAADFAKNILNFAPYMFGSVVYRAKDRTINWRYHDLHVFCDRHYLGDILLTNSSKGAYLHGNGIFERNHSADAKDERGDGLVEDNALRLMQFYKTLLLTKYSPTETSKIITNNTIYYYSNFEQKSPLIKFIKKTHQLKLVNILHLRGLGLLSLLMLPLSLKTKVKLAKIFKKK